MNTFKHRTAMLASAAALLAALSIPSLADSDDWSWGKGMMGHWFKGEMMNRGMTDGWGPGMMAGSRFSEERLGALKTELAITAAQTPMWDAYAAAVRDSADGMRKAHEQMMEAPAPATLPERLALHEGMMEARHAAMKSTAAATLALYDSLDEGQKKKADELIMGMGMM